MPTRYIEADARAKSLVERDRIAVVEHDHLVNTAFLVGMVFLVGYAEGLFPLPRRRQGQCWTVVLAEPFSPPFFYAVPCRLPIRSRRLLQDSFPKTPGQILCFSYAPNVVEVKRKVFFGLNRNRKG